MKRVSLIPLICMLAVPAAFAESLYVTDRITVTVRADVTPNSLVVGTLSTGAAVEVIERNGTLARVRDANGLVGWVEATALTTQPPAGEQLKSMRAELERARSQLANTQAQLEKERATPKPDTGKAEAELANARAQLSKIQAEIKKKDEAIAAATASRDAADAAREAAVKEAAALRGAVAREAAREPEPPTPEPAPQPTVLEEKSGFSFLWLGISFAMLVVGFIGGVIWVKESIRRRMGGMYLRI